MSSKNSKHCKVIHFREYARKGWSGKLTPIEGGKDIPFEIARLWDIRNVDEGESRGGHAHTKAQQVIRALSGSFWLIAKDKDYFDCYWLKNPCMGIYIPPGIWVLLVGFSKDAICQVYSDRLYEEEDYIT